MLVLTDIGNEPDDQMSLVRLLVYANALDIEGLVAATSVWQSKHTHAETIAALVEAYGEVRPNPMKHADAWPQAGALKAVIANGPVGYGMAAIRPASLSSGARRLIDAADKPDSRPLWIGVWGGANTLAEALTSVRSNRSSTALAAFVAKLRMYSISDQDDAGPWIRREFPNLFYIVQPSAPGSADYAQATWTRTYRYRRDLVNNVVHSSCVQLGRHCAKTDEEKTGKKTLANRPTGSMLRPQKSQHPGEDAGFD